MPYPPHQLYGLALAAIVTEYDDAHHDQLGGWGENANTRAWCREVLERVWQVTDSASFSAACTQLFKEGHRGRALRIAESLPADNISDTPEQVIARAHRETFLRGGLLAWDMGRLIAVSGWAFWAGYVEEKRAWEMILSAAYHCQRSFDSWENFGRHYLLGREFANAFTSNARDPRGDAILQKLLTEPQSPWKQLPWDLDLGINVDAVKRHLVKRSVCDSCGAPKRLASTTAWVYCDACGSLIDFDFRVAPAAAMTAAYQALAEKLSAPSEAARAAEDRAAFLALQRQLFAAYIDAAPSAMPPRTKNAAYRSAYVEFMAAGATCIAFDPQSRLLNAFVRAASAALQFIAFDVAYPKAKAETFWPLHKAWEAEHAHNSQLLERSGVVALHPDRASPAFQERLGRMMFVQGWTPYLMEDDAAQLVERCALKADYAAFEPPVSEQSACGGCGGELAVVKGARALVCEGCGIRVTVGGGALPCSGCGGRVMPPEDGRVFPCPFCDAQLERMRV